MTRDEHERAVSRMNDTSAVGPGCVDAEPVATWGGVYWPMARTLALGVLLAGLVWLAYRGCGDVPQAHADESPDAEAFALAAQALAWQPDAAPRAGTVRAVAVEVVAACREIVGARLGDDCSALLMALGWRESRWRPEVIGRAPFHAVGVYQLHGAALDTWTRAEARDLRRNTRLAADWLVQCDRACVGVEEALVMYATGTCRGTSRARWGARRLIRMARDLRAGGGQ